MQKKRSREEIAKEQSAIIKGIVGYDKESIRGFYKKVAICNPDYHFEVQRAYRSKLWLKLLRSFPKTMANLPEKFILADELARLKKTRVSRQKMLDQLFEFLFTRFSALPHAPARRDLLRMEWVLARLELSEFSGKIPKGKLKFLNGGAFAGGMGMLDQETHLDRGYPEVNLKKFRKLAGPKTLILYRRPSTQEIEILEPNRSLNIGRKTLLRRAATTICADVVL